MTTWIRRYAPSAAAAPVRLLCLPHAGGAASAYFAMAGALAPAVEVLAVQYPGRQDRRREAPLWSVDALADGVTAALAPHLDRPLGIFGHSMGAAVGYEVALRLEAAGTAVVRLFASGRRAPSRHRDEAVHRRDDKGIADEVRALDGTSAAILDDPEILAAALPALRADYTAIETYRAEPGRRLNCPITALVGDDDPKTTPGEAAAWAAHTAGRFQLRLFQGGHFFLVPRADEVRDVLRAQLTAFTTADSGGRP